MLVTELGDQLEQPNALTKLRLTAFHSTIKLQVHLGELG